MPPFPDSRPGPPDSGARSGRSGGEIEVSLILHRPGLDLHVLPARDHDLAVGREDQVLAPVDSLVGIEAWIVRRRASHIRTTPSFQETATRSPSGATSNAPRKSCPAWVSLVVRTSPVAADRHRRL